AAQNRSRFPPSKVLGPVPHLGVPGPTKHGLGVFLLPYLEQQDLYKQYRWDVGGADPGNQPLASMHVKVFQCPSAEPNRYLTCGRFGSYGAKGACGDSAPPEGVDPVMAGTALIAPLGNYKGAVEENVQTPLAAITDGTANTLVLAEDAGRPRLWQAGKPG